MKFHPWCCVNHVCPKSVSPPPLKNTIDIKSGCIFIIHEHVWDYFYLNVKRHHSIYLFFQFKGKVQLVMSFHASIKTS